MCTINLMININLQRNLTLRLCTHVSKQCPIFELDFLTFIHFYTSVYMHSTSHLRGHSDLWLHFFQSKREKKLQSYRNFCVLLIVKIRYMWTKNFGGGSLAANWTSDIWWHQLPTGVHCPSKMYKFLSTDPQRELALSINLHNQYKSLSIDPQRQLALIIPASLILSLIGWTCTMNLTLSINLHNQYKTLSIDPQKSVVPYYTCFSDFHFIWQATPNVLMCTKKCNS